MADAPLVLVLAADPILRQLLAEQLTGAGYRAQASTEPRAAARADLVLLADAADPVATLRQLRRAAPATPILALVESEPDIATFTAAGAAAALLKPVRVTELAARIAALLQGRGGDDGMPLGQGRFHPGARLLVDPGGHGVRLTEKEAAILLHLLRAQGRIVPRGELLERVWGYGEAVDTHTVETHIYRLRRKLGDPRLVVGLEGGYRLGASR